MASFLDDSTDEEIGVNLQLAERLRINRGDNVYSNNRTLTEKDHKQLCNQRKKNIYCGEQSSSSSSLELQNEACCSSHTSAYGPHNKKRQNGDKNIELLANPKRTCPGDRFGSIETNYGKSKSTNRDANCLTRKDKYSSKPLNVMKKGIYPDRTYEDCANAFSDDDSDFEPWRPFDRMKKTNNVERSRTVNKQENIKMELAGPENGASSHNGIQLIDSASEDDSRTVRQSGALKGGRQSPEVGTLRKVLGRKVKKLSDSDDESDGNHWQRKYRTRRLVFSSSDSDDSGPNKVSKKPVDLALKKSANLSFSPLNSLNSNLDHVYHEPDVPTLEVSYEEAFPHSPISLKQSNHRGRPASKTTKTRSNRNPVQTSGLSFENGASAIPVEDGLARHLGPSNLQIHHYSNSSKPSKGRTLGPPFNYPLQKDSPSLPSYSGYNSIPSNSFSLPNRVSTRAHPANGENSYRTSGATIPKMSRRQRTRSSKSPKGRAVSGARARNGLACRYPDISEDSSEVEFFTANSYSDTESNAEWLAKLRRNNTPVQDPTSDLINVGSSEDEISVVFTSVSPSSRNAEQRRGTPRTLGRRYSRGSRRHMLNTQDVVSLSPDPVEQVRQMEEDERFARMLQAQFDAEADPTYIPPNLLAPDSLMAMPDASSSESDSMDLEVIPRSSPNGFFALVNQFNFSPAPSSSPRRFRFRSRPRPEATRLIRRRWNEEIPFQATSLTRLLVAGAFDSSDDSYEAFLNLAELNSDVPRGLQKGEINRLPTRKYMTLNSATSSGAELPHKRAELNKECQVCLSDYVNGDVLRILPCFHEFHTPCIDPWLKINHTCPVCRVTVDLGEYE